MIGLVAGFSLSAYQRNFIWKDALSLWSDVVTKSPVKARPHNNLGKAYVDNGLIDAAILEITEALRLKPNTAVYYINLGNAYLEKGWLDKAIY